MLKPEIYANTFGRGLDNCSKDQNVRRKKLKMLGGVMSVEINRLKWRSRRSMLEVDLYLDRFIESLGLDKLSPTELTAYAALLELKDTDLLSLLQRSEQPEDHAWQSIINKIVSC